MGQAGDEEVFGAAGGAAADGDGGARDSEETAEEADEGVVGFAVDGGCGDADAPCGTVFHETGDGVFGSAWGDLDGEDAVSGP